MSWLARSLVNSLRGEEENEHEEAKIQTKSSTNKENDDDVEDPTRGVKEDLTELTKTLTRQFWGVASFLAPPPTSTDHPTSEPSDRSQPSDPTDSDGSSPRFGGIKGDLAEIGGRFKSMLSNTVAVSEISKIASTFLPFGEEEEEEENENGGGGVVGVSEEVVAFVRNVSMHPETWLDFPLIADEDDFDELDMSDAQQEHALAVERFAPRLAALRIELCPSHMSEGRFWKIYFVLLHSRLNRTDAELLTTPQILQARAMLLEDLHSRTKPKSEGCSNEEAPLPKEMGASVTLPEASVETSSSDTPTTDKPSTSVPINDETEKHTVQTTEVKMIDKSVIEENPPVQAKIKEFNSDATSNNDNTISIQKFEDDEDGDDEWLKEEEETGEVVGTANNMIPLGNEEDVSFSDLEEEDDDDQGTSRTSKTTTKDIASSNGKDSSDWLDVDDIDVE